jgi:hypothetical protein
MPEKQPPPSECANCGAAIPRNAKACPECGADERTGWRESSVYDGVDLPETAFDEKSTADRHPRRVNGVPWYWWWVGIVLITLLVVALLGLR